MTCREKLKSEHPEFVNDIYYGGCMHCPKTYKYLERPDYCPLNGSYRDRVDFNNACAICWDREIDETPDKDYSNTIIDIIENAMKTKDMRIDLYFGDSGVTCNIYPYNKD